MLRLLFILFISQCTFAQLNWISHKNKIEIPFELIYNLIIVDVKVNDVDLKMILDIFYAEILQRKSPRPHFRSSIEQIGIEQSISENQ